MNDQPVQRDSVLSTPRAFALGNWLLVLLIAAGIALRFRQYLFDRAFWLDEVKIGLNIRDNSLVELLTVPLAYKQSAPPGFLIWARGTWVALGSLGPSEMVLRTLPMTAGILILVLAYVLARRELKSFAAQVTFVGLTALSPILIFYSSEFKQYISDALFALAILVAVAYRHTRYGTWILAGAGFVAIVGSLPAVFVAAPAALLIFYEALRSGRWRQVFIVGAAWIFAAALHGAYILQAGVDRGYMVRSWAAKGSFAPLLPGSLADLQWYPAMFSGLTHLIFGEVGRAANSINASWFHPLGWPLMLILPIAAIAVLLSRRWTAIVAVGAIFTTLLASGFHAYPFVGRVIVFLLPVAMFIIAAWVDDLDRIAGPLLASMAALLLLSLVIPRDVKQARNPYTKSDMRGALEAVNQRFKEGDAIIIWNGRLYHYYAYKLTAPDIFVVEVSPNMQASAIMEKIKSKGYRRAWFVSAHKTGTISGLIKEIARSAPISFEWRARGTRAVLFDLTAVPGQQKAIPEPQE